MDALSQIFEDIHFKKTEYLYLQAQGQWSFQLNQQSAVITHIVLFGELFLDFINGDKIHLKTGDMLIIPSGMQHIGHSHADQKLVENFLIDDQFKGLRDDAVFLGKSTEQAQTLVFTIRSHLDSVMAVPLINALPNYLHLQNALNAQEPEWLRIGLYFVANETQKNQPGRHKIMDHVVSIMLIESVRDFINQQQYNNINSKNIDCNTAENQVLNSNTSAHTYSNIDNHSEHNNWLFALTHPELSNAFTAIHSQPEKNWTVESLAEVCFMSRSKFAKMFHSIVGEPPLSYLKQHRLRLACQQLRNGQMPIQQIAHKVGYTSETAFSQAFKKQFSMSPSQYKQFYAQKHQT